MLTKKIKNRVLFLTTIFIVSSFFLIFIYLNLKQNILYFKTPSEIFISTEIDFSKLIRVGGMVKKDSVEQNDQEVKFILTDYDKEIIVVFKGAVPNLFSEGQGAVVEGLLNDKKFLIANKILAKHDENYMPPQMKKILEENAK